MKSFMTIAATAVCALTLTACGGGGSGTIGPGSTLSRPDEGIWNTPAGGVGPMGVGMQTVILSDGSYWSIFGSVDLGAPPFYATSLFHGTASVNGSNATGTYQGYSQVFEGSGTYSGTVSAQNSLNLNFDSYTYDQNLSGFNSLNIPITMNYDPIYNQPALFTSIDGSYSGYSFLQQTTQSAGDLSTDSSLPLILTISGSNFTITQGPSADALCSLSGTLAPHGNGSVNVFDASFTVNCVNSQGVFTENTVVGWPLDIVHNSIVPRSGVTYNGILFQSSGFLKNYIELLADNGTSSYFFMGSK